MSKPQNTAAPNRIRHAPFINFTYQNEKVVSNSDKTLCD